MRQLLRDRNIALLLAGQTLTMFGDWALLFVLGIWVKQLTGSDSAAGMVFLIFALPAFLAPLTGLLVDRFSRRRVLIVNDLLSAALILLLLTIAGRQDLWLLYAVTFGYGVSNQVYQAARGGLVHSAVSDAQLGAMNSLLGSLQQGMRVVGPLVGAGLFAAFGGPAVVIFDAATFLLSAVLLSVLRLGDLPQQPATTAAAPGLIHEMIAGARHIFNTRLLRRSIGAAVLAFCTIGLLEVAIFALVDQGLHRPPTFVGVLGALQGLGACIGGLLTNRLLQRLDELRVGGIGLALLALSLLVLVAPALPLVICSMIGIGAGLTIFMIAHMTLLQRRTAPELQGRVLTASEGIMTIPYTLSLAFGALGIALADIRLIYLINAIVIGSASGLLFSARVGSSAARAGETPVLGDDYANAGSG